MGMTAPSLKIN